MTKMDNWNNSGKDFLFDITAKPFGNQSQFEDVIQDYPNGTMFLVTKSQHGEIVKFGNFVRWIDMTDKGIKQDVLVYDSSFGSFRFMTGRGLEK